MFKRLKYKIISAIYQWAGKHFWPLRNAEIEKEREGWKDYDPSKLPRIPGVEDRAPVPTKLDIVNCVAGSQTTLYFNDTVIKDIQKFEYKRELVNDKKILTGTMHFVVFNKMHDYLGQEVHLVAKALVDGKEVIVFDDNIKFNEESYDISIEDIVSEQIFKFIGVDK